MTTIVEPTAPWLRDLNRVVTNDNRVAPFVPPADVIVDEDAVTVYMDIPGLSGEQLDVELENEVLTVRGERPFPYAANGQAEIRRVERAFGRFERSLRVVSGLDPAAIEATLSLGVLTLRLPKPESLKPHRIDIAGGDEQPRQIEGSSGS
jgi:HSP20 family protein